MYVGILTEEEAEAVGRMTGQSVTKGSARGYSATWTKWLEFGQAQAGKNRPGVWLEGAEREETKAQWLVLFLEYLYRERGLRGAKEASATMSALRYFWTKEGRGSGFFAAALVTAAKKGARRSTEEVRGRAELKEERAILPICPEIVMQLRKDLWEMTGWDREGLDRKAIWLAAAVSFDSGLRPCNVTLKDGKDKEDHCVRARDMLFQVKLRGGEEGHVRGGEELREFLGTRDGGSRDVLRVDIRVLTGKTMNKGSFSSEGRVIARESVWESLLLEDLCEFTVRSGVCGEDEFVTRYWEGSRKVTTAKALREAVKGAADALGLPAFRFGGKSCRSGFATHMDACGEDRVDLYRRAGWAVHSAVPEEHYIRSYAVGALSRMGEAEGEGIGLAGLKRMLPSGPGVTLSIRRVANV